MLLISLEYHTIPDTHLSIVYETTLLIFEDTAGTAFLEDGVVTVIPSEIVELMAVLISIRLHHISSLIVV